MLTHVLGDFILLYQVPTDQNKPVSDHSREQLWICHHHPEWYVRWQDSSYQLQAHGCVASRLVGNPAHLHHTNNWHNVEQEKDNHSHIRFKTLCRIKSMCARERWSEWDECKLWRPRCKIDIGWNIKENDSMIVCKCYCVAGREWKEAAVGSWQVSLYSTVHVNDDLTNSRLTIWRPLASV